MYNKLNKNIIMVNYYLVGPLGLLPWRKFRPGSQIWSPIRKVSELCKEIN